MNLWFHNTKEGEMDLWMAVIILASGLCSIYADILLFSGKNASGSFSINEKQADKITGHRILLSGFIRLLACVFWMMPLYYLSHLPTFAGMTAFMSFAAFILAASVFHIALGFILYAFRQGSLPENTMQRQIRLYGLVYLFWAAVYSCAMIALNFNGTLNMNLIHYFTLPLPAVLIIQLFLGAKWKKQPYFSDISGTLAMMVSLLSTVNIMVSNQI